ncbi:MAG: hypothetical protein AAF550_10415 [Myxococcota bacterium]
MDREEAFGRSVEAHVDGDHDMAAAAALMYLESATEDDPRYDRAQMTLAGSLKALGLNYGASLYYLDIAQSRRNVDLLNRALESLAALSITDLVDEELVLRAFVASEDLSGLPRELANFVHFVKGRDSLRRNELAWAERSFAGIEPDSPYYPRAQLVTAAHAISQSDLEEAEEVLSPLAETEAPLVPKDVRSEARLALARIALDRQRVRDAIAHYEEVQSVAPERPGVVLEMAWAHYYRGNFRRSLGLLIALDAPVFEALIAPERYLLEAYNLRKLCQLDLARVAVNRLRSRHGEALQELESGIPAIESEVLRRSAKERPSLRRETRLVEQVRSELDRAREIAARAGDAGDALLQTYEAALDRLAQRHESNLNREVRQLATELASASDGLRLLLHELSVQLLRGRARPDGPAPRGGVSEIPTGEVAYSFTGEFWTDEMDDLEVTIEDRCLQ